MLFHLCHMYFRSTYETSKATVDFTGLYLLTIKRDRSEIWISLRLHLWLLANTPIWILLNQLIYCGLSKTTTFCGVLVGFASFAPGLLMGTLMIHTWPIKVPTVQLPTSTIMARPLTEVMILRYQSGTTHILRPEIRSTGLLLFTTLSVCWDPTQRISTD